MHQGRALLCLAAVGCGISLLLGQHPAAAARPGGVLDNSTPLDGSESSTVDLARLRRVRRNSNYKGSVTQLQATLVQQPSLSIDATNDRLFYACSGLALEPEVAAAEAAAVAAQSAAFDAAVAAGQDPTPYATFLQPRASGVPLDDPATLDPATAGHHHHHHHRHLLQTGNGELTSMWLPDMFDVSTTNITRQQAFSLHSRPGATRKIFLDFDGHTITGSAWNKNCKVPMPTIVTPPFDTDGNTTNWSPSELLTVLAAWRTVSEDFAPFDVDVTTEEPSASVLSSSGVRVSIGGDGAWFSACQNTTSRYGGVAYLSTFGGGTYYTPAFVWPQNLGNNAKYIAEASSHEVGHTLSLMHDGFKDPVTGATTSEYSSGVAGWGPLMGAPYNSAVTQWSK